jgi:glycosyltransferase involved in cell wall biosynthesis
MRILLVNWQDWANPQAGGAEVHLREIFRRIAERGHTVNLLCSSYRSARSEEVLDGIRIIRRGGRYNFNYVVMMTLRKLLRLGDYDILVEDINKIPFYVPLFCDVPEMVIVPHLFGTTVFHEVRWPLALYVYAWEVALRHVYREARFEVISESTKADLVARGIPPEHIYVVYCGLDHDLYTAGPGEREETGPPYILYLGRLKRYKRVELALEAFKDIRDRVEGIRLVIAGDGDYRPALEKASRRMGLAGDVFFHGRVSSEEKVKLLRGASLVVNTSEKEGWGLTNVEAQACGCPVVSTDSPGLRESVVHGRTGFLVSDRDKGELVDRSIVLLTDPKLRHRFSEEARKWANRFSWEDAADRTIELMETVVSEDHGRPS